MLTYLSCSPIVQAIPRFLSETFQELTRNTILIKTPQRHCQSFCACDKQNRDGSRVQNKSYAFLFLLCGKNTSEDFMLLCQIHINQDKQISFQGIKRVFLYRTMPMKIFRQQKKVLAKCSHFKCKNYFKTKLKESTSLSVYASIISGR